MKLTSTLDRRYLAFRLRKVTNLSTKIKYLHGTSRFNANDGRDTIPIPSIPDNKVPFYTERFRYLRESIDTYQLQHSTRYRIRYRYLSIPIPVPYKPRRHRYYL